MTYPIELNTQNLSSYIDLNKLYASHGIKEIIKRQCEYMRDRPYSNPNKILFPVVWVVGGGIVGFKLASKVADFYKLENEKKQAAKGGGIVIGCVVGACLYTCSNELNIFFKTWKTLRLEMITNSYIFAKHQNDPFLSKFIDCIEYTPLKAPVRLSSGHLMDLDSIKKIKPNPQTGEVMCPMTREKIDLDNPNIHLELHILIMKRIQFLLQQDLIQLDPTSKDYQATKLQLDFIESRLVSAYSQHLKGIEHLLADGKITLVESNRLRTQFCNYFGEDPIGKADPENEYEAHVMNFDLDWKKIIKNHDKILFKGTSPTKFMEEV